VVEVAGPLTGTLQDGFEILIQCGTTPPELDGVYTLGTYIQPTMFATVLTDGPYAGMTCTHNNTDGRMYVFDHTIKANGTPATSWFYQQGGWGIECGMNNGLMIALGAISVTNLRVYNQTSGSVVQTVPTNRLYAICGDLDGSDDFWCIVNFRPTANPNWYSYYLQHYAYSAGTYTFADEWDVTDLFADEISSTYRWEVFGDLVILPDATACFVLTGTQGTPDGHKVDKVDLTGASPAIVATHAFTETLDGDGQIDIAQSRAVKMDIDFSDEDYTQCRLIVAGSSVPPRHLHIYRFDTDLNLLGHSDTPFDIHGNHIWYGMTLDMQHGCISLVEDIPWGLSETYYGYCSLPSDW
jgi:hypothetical protein